MDQIIVKTAETLHIVPNAQGLLDARVKLFDGIDQILFPFNGQINLTQLLGNL